MKPPLACQNHCGAWQQPVGRFQDSANTEPTSCGSLPLLTSNAGHFAPCRCKCHTDASRSAEVTSSALWSVPYCSMLTKLGLK